MTINYIVKAIGMFNDEIFHRSIITETLTGALSIADQIIGNFLVSSCRNNSFEFPYDENNSSIDNKVILNSFSYNNDFSAKKGTHIFTYSLIINSGNITVYITPIDKIETLEEFYYYKNQLFNNVE